MQKSKPHSQNTGSIIWKERMKKKRSNELLILDGLIQIKTGDFIDIANTKAKQFYSLLIEIE